MKFWWALILATAGSSACAWAEPVHIGHVTAGEIAYQTAEIDLQQADLKLYWKKADGTMYAKLTAVRSELSRNFLFATNSGIYSTTDTPLGLHVERGKILVPLNRSHASTGNFYMQPNGVFFINGKTAHVMETAAYFKARPANITEACQSGPLLLQHGNVNPKFSDGSDSLKVRSGVGVNADGHVVFAISDGRVSFYDFAIFFRDTLHCQDALYLDGTISTFLTPDAVELQFTPFAGIWAASLH